ncbi:dienelactone hydrolase family protein [Sneathiella marina]|uniref:Dienelactone hydrolase family protein n=1 Tax=Sneathiella marina TaxID=2950108 RepID=A0ABY4W1P5_9PROT|nr:dienelactone hydrolase family protein [Sneathiella marina]USG61093.1 dienelactone hydrolase family protein [Sneathiella marina]
MDELADKRKGPGMGYVFTTLVGRSCCAALLIAMNWTAAPEVAAEEISFMSASPYQLGDLLKQPDPSYDVEIKADLVFPENMSEPMPAFIYMHGSSGRLLRHQRYLELARERGFVTLQIDSFGPRGVTSTIGNQTNVTAAMMTTDILRSIDYLSQHPNVDPDRIVIMGSSKGAVAALYSAWTPARKKVLGDRGEADYILLYPLCVTIEDGDVTNKSVHVFIGKEDNWTPAAPCIAEVRRMKSLGKDWAITLYEGAYHGFDASISGTTNLPHAYSMADCNVALRADGYEYETGSGYLLTRPERRLAFKSCAKKGSVKMGGTHALDAFMRDVGEFLDKAVE